jgi:hypothetical protein
MIKRSKPPRNPRPKNPLKNRIKAPPTRIRRSKPHTYEDGASSTVFRLIRGPLDGKPRPRKTSDSYDPGYTAHLGMGSEKAATIHTMPSTVLPSTTPRRARRQPLHPGFLGLGIIRSPSTSLSHVPTRPRAPPVNKGMTPVRRPQGIARSPQDPGPFTVPSSTSPRHSGDGRPLPGHVTTATSTVPAESSPLRHYLRVLGIPRPSLDSIKERAEGSPKRTTKIDIFSTSEINISSNTLFFSFLET